MDSRPAPCRPFLTGSRKLDVFFYTSNEPKYLQAKAVCRSFGLDIRHFPSHTEPYIENHTSSKRELLEQSVSEVISKVGANSVFFVEDTSVRIEALSASSDFPGLDVKPWFASTTFEKLDRELRMRANDRRATVMSDIALHLPGLSQPILFSGETSGIVAASPPGFDMDAQHPWLTPDTFNGWFIPEGTDRRLGEMSFEESWDFDFRIRALTALIRRLEEYAAVLNLPGAGYTTRAKTIRSHAPGLFETDQPPYIVVGRTCAGKTTLGEHAERTNDARVVDASGIMRMLRRESGEKTLSSFEFAKLTIESRGPDIVARKIIDLYGDELDRGLVITGFRTIEELNTIRAVSPQARVVLVDASPRTRFERYLRRGRGPQCTTLDEFEAHDQEQWVFGLLRVAEDFADIRITNEESLEHYLQQVEAVIGGERGDNLTGISRALRPRHSIATNQVYRCLAVLSAEDRPMTCQEINQVLRLQGGEIRPNNIAKTLRNVPELARELRSDDQRRVRYETTAAGRAYVRIMESRSRSARTE